MDIKELKVYRTELLAERQAKIEEIMVNYQKKIDAIGILLDDEQGVSKIGINGHSDIIEATPENQASNIHQAVREAIAACRKPNFSSKSLFSYIRQKYPQMADSAGNLSNPLWRLNRDGKIQVVHKGAGRRPSIYRVAKDLDASQTNGEASEKH